MYFPLSKLHGWGKRSAVQPKTIYSEIPLFFMSEYFGVLVSFPSVKRRRGKSRAALGLFVMPRGRSALP